MEYDNLQKSTHTILGIVNMLFVTYYLLEQVRNLKYWEHRKEHAVKISPLPSSKQNQQEFCFLSTVDTFYRKDRSFQLKKNQLF